MYKSREDNFNISMKDKLTLLNRDPHILKVQDLPKILMSTSYSPLTTYHSRATEVDAIQEREHLKMKKKITKKSIKKKDYLKMQECVYHM